MQFEITEEMRADYHAAIKNEMYIGGVNDTVSEILRRGLRQANTLRDAVAWGLRVDFIAHHEGLTCLTHKYNDERHTWTDEQWRQEAHRLLMGE